MTANKQAWTKINTTAMQNQDINQFTVKNQKNKTIMQ